MRSAFQVTMPRERRWPWVALLVSLVIHAGLLLVRVHPWLPPIPPRLPQQVVLIPLGTEGPRAVDLTFEAPSAGGARTPSRTSGVTVVTRPETGQVAEEQPADTGAVVAEIPSEPAPAAAAPGPPRPGRTRLGPSVGDGKLWVRPLPLPPQDLARVLTRSHAELVDSAVTAIVQVYIDSVLNAEPLSAPVPRWVTSVGEQQIGVDSKWIYLGPIKIPTALVAAFLPLGGGSAETADYPRFRQLQQMREDVARAAQRAQTMADFKRAIRELREERERQREFERNQRIAPEKADTTKPKPRPIP